MLKVGITGGIGSGKSLVCRAFNKLGVYIFHSDDIAKNIINTDSGVRAGLTDFFGTKIFDNNKMVDRQVLASIIFSDVHALEKINNLVHPKLAQAFESWLENKLHCKYILKEAAIMFESNSYKILDKIICVTAPVEERINRVINRDKTTREDIIKRINMQMDDSERIKKSDYIIINDGKTKILSQIIKIHNHLSRE